MAMLKRTGGQLVNGRAANETALPRSKPAADALPAGLHGLHSGMMEAEGPRARYLAVRLQARDGHRHRASGKYRQGVR